jgi:putative nucleotidyltransferase with HDIG domain
MTTAKDIDGLMMLLTRAVAQRRLYGADHPKVTASCRDLAERLATFLQRTQQDGLFLGIADGKLVYDGRYLIGPTIAGGQLIQLARKLKCGGFVLGRHAGADEFGRFLALTAERRDAPADLAEARALLASRGISRISLSAEFRDTVASEDGAPFAWDGRAESGEELPSPLLVYQALFDVVSGVHGDALQGHVLDIDGARAAGEHLLSSARSSFTDIAQLVDYPDHDTYTVGHSVRVATLAVHVAGHLGLPAESQLALSSAALLHDVGKSKVPEEILYKPSRLDRKEIEIIRAHTEIGAEILLEQKGASPLDLAAAYGHHIRHDGGGYPERPTWVARHPLVALLQICDVFEALTAVRPYKSALTPRAAFEIMVGDVGAFDPALLRAFIRAVGLYPPGNRVRLSDGRQGVVVAKGLRVDAPRVRVTHDAAGTCMPEADQPVIELYQSGATIVKLLRDPEPARV